MQRVCPGCGHELVEIEPNLFACISECDYLDENENELIFEPEEAWHD